MQKCKLGSSWEILRRSSNERMNWVWGVWRRAKKSSVLEAVGEMMLSLQEMRLSLHPSSMLTSELDAWVCVQSLGRGVEQCKLSLMTLTSVYCKVLGKYKVKPSVVVNAYGHSPGEMVARGSGVQGYLWLQRGFEINLWMQYVTILLTLLLRIY